MVRKALLLTVAAVSTFVAGCSGGVEGSATADRPAADDPFDPCSIPDDVISAAGLDPVSKNSPTENGYATPGWSVCGWELAETPRAYSYSVFFTPEFSMDDVRRNPRNSEFSAVVVDGRDSLMFRSDIVDPSDTCNLAFATTRGVAMFTVLKSASAEALPDLCEAVVEHTDAISVALPGS